MALARQLTNVGARGQDARYDITGLSKNERGNYTDGTYEYDSRGLDLSGRKAQSISGLRGADEDFVDGQVSYAGGGGGGGGSIYGQYAAQAKLAYDNTMARIKSERQSTRADYGFNAEGTELDGMNLLGKFQQMFRTSAGVLDKSREGALMRGLGRRGLGARVALEPKYDLDVAAKDLSSGYQSILARLAGQEADAENAYQQALLMAMMMQGGWGDDGGGGDDYAEDDGPSRGARTPDDGPNSEDLFANRLLPGPIRYQVNPTPKKAAPKPKTISPTKRVSRG